MLQGLSKEIRDCYARAEACARKAEQSFSEEMRADFLRLEQSWLTLAAVMNLPFGSWISRVMPSSRAKAGITPKRRAPSASADVQPIFSMSWNRRSRSVAKAPAMATDDSLHAVSLPSAWRERGGGSSLFG
jgi:hypothetical protein